MRIDSHFWIPIVKSVNPLPHSLIQLRTFFLADSLNWWNMKYMQLYSSSLPPPFFGNENIKKKLVQKILFKSFRGRWSNFSVFTPEKNDIIKIAKRYNCQEKSNWGKKYMMAFALNNSLFSLLILTSLILLESHGMRTQKKEASGKVDFF